MKSSKKAALALGVAVTALGAAAGAQVPPPGSPAPGSPAAPAAAPPPAPYPSSLQAGGLVPPPSTPQTAAAAPPTPTEQALEDAKKEDSKRGLEWFWINAEGGFSHVDLRTFSSGDKDLTAGFFPTQSIGASAGGGLGARFLFFTIGARGRYGFYSPWQMWSAGGEIGFHVPIGRLDPHIELGGGYASLINVSGAGKGTTDAITVAGGYGRVSGGIDIYIVPRFSVGLTASGDFLALMRPALTAEQVQAIKNDPKLSDPQRAAADQLASQASSYGTAVGVTAVLGLHF